MAAIAFAVPRPEGKDDASQKLIGELTGETGEQLHQRRRQHGFRRIRVWHQDTPQRLTIIYLEADDLQAVFAGLATSQVPFDHWFREHAREIHGIDLEQGFPPPEQTVDYRRADAASSPEPAAMATARG